MVAAPMRELAQRLVAGAWRGFLGTCLLACCTQCGSTADVCLPFADGPRREATYEEKDWGALDVGRRQRVVVLTDFGNEPDDAQSLVRLLVYANEIDIEGILATTSMWLRGEVQASGVRAHVDAYGRVRETLLAHAPGYPPVETLRARVHPCRPVYGMRGVGPGMDSEGSDHILEVLGRADERPLWIAIWGGSNCLAQALWRLQQTQTADEVDRIVSRLRVYSISDQDDAGACIRAAFPKLSYIVSPSRQVVWQKLQDMTRATYPGISGDRFHWSLPAILVCPVRARLGWPCEPVFRGPRYEIVDDPWLTEHVRSHGPLGARYPEKLAIMEGDTPSFLNLVDNGLAGAARPDWGGWGGRYELDRPERESRAIWTDAEDTVVAPDGNTYTSNRATIWRWREAYQADFAARMDWSVAPRFAAANHPPSAVVNGDATGQPLFLDAVPDERVSLTAAGSSDPDGDTLAYAWWSYPEAGSPPAHVEVRIENGRTENASLTVPAVTPGSELHVILEVEDDGAPSLRSYRRVVVRVGAGERGEVGTTASEGAGRHGRLPVSAEPPCWPKKVKSQIGRAAERAESSALVVVHRDEVVLEWGAVARRLNSQSIRKSLLSALLGVAVDRGLLDVGRTVGSLDLPEGKKLNDVERSATIRQLMMARSGIYLRAAHELPMTMLRRPRRNAHAPGEHWYYNNWDFNALGVIFEQSAGLGIGEAFHRWIAVPIGMKDFRPKDVTYERWPGSRHPAYPLRITARDLTAFGLLLAREGRWGDRQVISREWVQASTHPYSDTGVSGYGFMWWVEQGGRLYAPDIRFPSGSFMGFGFGGQYLVVVPACQLVVVNLVDTGGSKFEQLRWLVLGDAVEPDELASILRPILLQAGCADRT
jgi:CubicO group peptidase (beta-lactamase class C family)